MSSWASTTPPPTDTGDQSPSALTVDRGRLKSLRFAVAAHSYAEAYSTLTRRGGPAPFGFAPAEAWAALESVRAVTDLVGLTAAQTFDMVRRYAGDGGVGPASTTG
jgi:hypothetical protein